jgi:hypothetical protein
MKELAKAIQHFDKDIVIGGGRHDYCMKLKNNVHTYFNKKKRPNLLHIKLKSR